MAYYQLNFAADSRNWFLVPSHSAIPVDVWACEPCVATCPIEFDVYKDGCQVDFNESTHAIIVVSCRLASVLQRLGGFDVQILAASIHEDFAGWVVLNLLAKVDCIDHERSRITYYPRNHPEKPGKPRGVLKLVLDPARIGDHHIFHPKDWEVVTIVSEKVKQAMEEIGATGVEFWPVTE